MDLLSVAKEIHKDTEELLIKILRGLIADKLDQTQLAFHLNYHTIRAEIVQIASPPNINRFDYLFRKAYIDELIARNQRVTTVTPD